MSPALWSQVKALYDEAAEMPAPTREDWLGTATDDPAVREEVRRLLSVANSAGDFFDTLGRQFREGPPEDSREAPLPERIGPWRVLREVGRGGMGQVFLAERADALFEQRVALKLVHAGLAPDLIARFEAERRILARLDHPGIARVIDGGVADDGRPYLALAYVEGEPLTAHAERRQLDVGARLGLFLDVCEAVAYAHRHLVVHRDLKPSNILVAEDDEGRPQTVLLDFGIAKLLEPEAGAMETRTGRALLTPHYAAPEQIRGEAVTTATDVYALGVVLYELLAGQRPFHPTERSRQAVERAVLETEPTAPSAAADRRRLHGDLDTIVLKALRKEPSRRYEGAASLARDLRRHLGGLPIEARGESVVYRVGRFARRHRSAVALAGLALVALLVGLGAALWQASEAEVARAIAEAEAQTASRATDVLVEVFGTSDPHQARGDTLSAYDILARGLAVVDTLDAEPAVQARLLHALGNVYGNLGSYREGADLLRRAIALERRQAGETVDLRLMLSNLGRLLHRNGDSEAAAEVLREAIAQFDAAPAPDRERQADALTSLGLALHKTGDYEASAAASRRSFEVAGRRPSEATAFRYNTLALALEGLGELAEAVTMHRRAVRIRERISDPDPIEQAYTEGNLARVLARLGETAEAEGIALRAVDRMRRTAGDRHPDVAPTLTDLGRVYEADGRYDQALATYREALGIHRETVGPDHPDALVTLNNVGVTLARMGRNAEAAEVLSEALDRVRRTRGDDDPEVATGLNNVASLEERLGRTGRARVLFAEAVALGERVYGPEHVATAQFRVNLGRAFARDGETAEAEAAFRQSLRAFEAGFPEDHLMIGVTAMELGRVLASREDPEAARPMLERARRVFQSAADSARTAQVDALLREVRGA